MSQVDTRQLGRDSLFLLANLRFEERGELYRVKVRNLSSGGMMAEGDSKVMRGSLVAVELRNIGWVEGSVAWKQENRFGIAFVDEIDPAEVRAPGAPLADSSEFEIPRYTRTHQALPMSREEREKLRKI